MPQLDTSSLNISNTTASPSQTPSSQDGQGQDGSFGQALGQARGDTSAASGSASSDTSTSAHARDTSGSDPSGKTTAEHSAGHAKAGRDAKHATQNDSKTKTLKDHGKGHDKSGDNTTDPATALPLSVALASILRPAIAAGTGKILPQGGSPAASDVAGAAAGPAGKGVNLLDQLPSSASAATSDAGHASGDSAASLLADLKAAASRDANGKTIANTIGLPGLNLKTDGGKNDSKDAIDAARMALNALNATQTAAPQTAAAAPHQLQIATPPGSSEFAQALGQQVAWLGNQDIKQATIHLNPRNLGPLNVNVQVNNHGQVDVSFAVQHPGTVHALQQTLPQLDTLLAQQGLSLGQAQVGQQQQGQQGSSQGFNGDGGTGDADPSVDALAPAMHTRALGLVDDFA